MILALALLTACHVSDGDTLNCNHERIRLLGIDSAELPRHCARTRHCAPGDPYAAKAALEARMHGKTLTIRRVTKDRYGRTVAVVYADGVNLSCAQLAGGFAIYKRQWDTGRWVARECPKVAR